MPVIRVCYIGISGVFIYSWLMEKTKLICCDIDSTLSFDHLGIPEINKKTIRKAVLEEGIHFAIISGRNALSVKDFMDQIGIKGVLPSLGGALLEDWDGNLIEEHTIDKELALELYTLAKEMGCILFAYHRSDWFLEPCNDFWANYESKALKIPAKLASLPELFQTTKIHKLLGVSRDSDKVTALMNKINKRYKGIIDAYKSSPYYLEIMLHGVNKGTAINALCKHYDIKKDNVMAIGDYYNDVDMFKTAGISVAVNNAPEDIKALTTFVTSADCEHGAVAEAIERFCVR